MPHTVLGYILSVGWGIAKSEADPLFVQVLLSHCGLSRRFQKFYEFGIGFDDAKELFPVCHNVPLFTFCSAGFPNGLG
jgi:hypothetical protein